MGYEERTSVFWLAAIGKERIRQMEKENCSHEHDDGHTDGAIALAAACYALPERFRKRDDTQDQPELWPWEEEDWKPSPANRMRELIKAGALIVAELERIDRMEAAAVPEVTHDPRCPKIDDHLGPCDFTVVEVSEETMATVKEAHDRVTSMGERLLGEEPVEQVEAPVSDRGRAEPKQLCPTCKGSKVQVRGFGGNRADGPGGEIIGGCLTCDRTGEVPQ